MHNAIELDRLIQYIGEQRARELADLASGGYFGIPHEAYDALAAAVKGFGGMYGAASNARNALQDLMERYRKP